MSPRLRETSVDLEVPFRHVDPLGVVWHGHYFSYMEEARTALLRRCDLDRGDLVGARYLLFVIESHCRHGAPLRYRDRFRVTAWLREIRRRIHVAYELTNQTLGRRAARGYTLLATTDLDRQLLLETPDEIRRRMLGG